MKILHTADIHLTAYGDERWQALQGLIALGQEEGIAIFVVSGDLFDHGVNAEELRPALRALFSGTGFKICLIPGNHDRDAYAAGMYFGEDTVILADIQKPFVHNEVTIWGIPFAPTSRETFLHQLHGLAPRLTPATKHIVLYHGELLDAFFARSDFGEEGDERYMPARLSYFDGSPVSITKKETGQRRINLFELGTPPHEHPLDTPHFEDVVITGDPFTDKNPLEMLQERFAALPENARAILTVQGFINGEALGMTEEELVKRAKKLVQGRCVEEHYEFRDIRMIVEDDLFKEFLKKLDHAALNGEKKEQIRQTAIRAMMGARR
jgi:exonuclease SbcD